MDAARLLDAGDVDGAIALCQHGIALYPEYATGYLVIARAYIKSGAPDAARSMAQLGLQHAPYSTALRAITEAQEVEVEAPLTPPDAESTELDRIANELIGARIPPIDPTIPIPKGDPPRADILVTPTLAKIYEQQGLIDEAIGAYRSLAAQHDASEAVYNERILTLEKRKAHRGELPPAPRHGE